ncbi:hypothetical protein JTE90_019812 [Oedothorax gibbosus]|uniref:Uncharacterized protein n=1 Tax=Oedothorax gibbosus TaxID=931172 RepID=A0AAV6V5I2_9ARAC|nr:hypothetical protein JTE90_019812 [Oedothorax gibbosus]
MTGLYFLGDVLIPRDLSLAYSSALRSRPTCESSDKETTRIKSLFQSKRDGCKNGFAQKTSPFSTEDTEMFYENKISRK